jgi:hypothetical protein
MEQEVTPEQLSSRVELPETYLISPCGTLLPVSDGTIVGRDPGSCDVAVRHASVSVVHARLSRIGGAWTVLDLGSRNGTDVDGAPARPRVAVAAGARIRIGDVVFVFSGLRIRAAATGRVFELVPREDGGLVRDGGQVVLLTALEHRLLQMLALRRDRATDPELAYVPSQAIAESMGFQSIDADTDNVRELVHRVRRKLRAAGLGDPIKSRRGVGYRLDGDLVTAAPVLQHAA